MRLALKLFKGLIALMIGRQVIRPVTHLYPLIPNKTRLTVELVPRVPFTSYGSVIKQN